MRFLRCALLTSPLVFAAGIVYAQGGPPDHPTVTIDGHTYTPLSIFTRNMGSDADQSTAFPPFKIIDNIYYVGTRTLSSYLIVTPAGNILIDSTWERNVPVIQKSVEQLGFTFADTKILLGNHAHPDHMEGDALVKQLTGAQVMAMAEDVPALQNMKPGGKEHPIDRILHDGDVVTLGNATLVAHLMAGHTRGCTTFTTTARDNGRAYNVVFGCSLRAPNTISPAVEAEFIRSFKVVRGIACDIQLGDHPAQFGMEAKRAAMRTAKTNPFIDVRSCRQEIDIEEAMFKAILAEQQQTK